MPTEKEKRKLQERLQKSRASRKENNNKEKTQNRQLKRRLVQD